MYLCSMRTEVYIVVAEINALTGCDLLKGLGSMSEQIDNSTIKVVRNISDIPRPNEIRREIPKFNPNIVTDTYKTSYIGRNFNEEKDRKKQNTYRARHHK